MNEKSPHLDRNTYLWLNKLTGIALPEMTITLLEGGISSLILLLESKFISNTPKFVLRIVNNPAWLAEEPFLALHEASALELSNKLGIIAPKLIGFVTPDLGFEYPMLLMGYLEGKLELGLTNQSQILEGLGLTLSEIHKHSVKNFPWKFNSWVEKSKLVSPAWTRNKPLWERAISYYLKTKALYQPVFIHRDYHPMNVLWHQARVSGIVDWANACEGPAGVDVGHCRANLVLMFGKTEANLFLESYCKAAPDFCYDPYWDLETIFDMNLPEPTFYSPWEKLGLKVIAPEILKERLEEYLEEVMKNLSLPR